MIWGVISCLAMGSSVTMEAVIAGVESRDEAMQIERSLQKELGDRLQRHRPPVQTTVKEVNGIWLVKVAPLNFSSGEPDPLLSSLLRRYPGTMLLSTASKRGGASASFREQSTPEGTEHLSHGFDLQELSPRWEWLALGLLLLIGFFAILRHRIFLGKISNEQKRLEYRQRSLRARMKSGEDE